MDYVVTYLFVGFFVALIGSTVLFIQGKDTSLSGFLLDILLWPVVIGYWCYYGWQDD
jgi:hypothetical protein